MKMGLSRENTRRVIATSAKQWDARFSHEHPHDNRYYGLCCVAGVLSCGLTHFAVTPLDVAKCNMQVDPTKYKSLSFHQDYYGRRGHGCPHEGLVPNPRRLLRSRYVQVR